MNDDEITGDAFLAAKGNAAAAARFVAATERQLYRLLRHLSHAGIADDLVQETYLRAFAALPGYAGRSPARAWLLSIARRVAADHLRAHRRHLSVVHLEDWDIGRVSAPVPDHGRLVVLRRLIAELEPQRRRAFVLTQELGLSYTDAAKLCGCAVGTIRSRVFRAREDLLAAMCAGGEAVSRAGR